MKLLARLVRTSAATSLIVCGLLWGMIAGSYSSLAENYYVTQESGLSFSDYITATASGSVPSSNIGGTKETETELRLFGVFPIKTVTVSKIEIKKVVPGGIPFGIKMISDGVLVTSTGSVQSEGKTVCPAKEAGIKASDVIVSINGKQMQSNQDVIKTVSKCAGETLRVVLRKSDGDMRQVDIKPVKDSSDNTYKIGIWVRDSSAGIGTVTFYDPESEVFAGLGHAVCDSSTGDILSLLEGEVVGAQIDGVTRGKAGAPGQLNGHFATISDTGCILKNDETGVYGKLEQVKVTGEAVPVALKQEVKTGKATILATLSGFTPQEYEIEIEKISLNTERAIKNMVVRVTDERLLSQAGGIVQGMSGSPILQNGKLIGAVTHVFVNDPTRGYGIFAETMLKSSDSVKETLKAS